MTDLAAFLLQRIAEDEADVTRFLRSGYTWDRAVSSIGDGYTDNGLEAARRLVTRFDPARVLAECEAKRGIVEMCMGTLSVSQGRVLDSGGVPDGMCEVLPFLALPYASHPDYREEWKP